MGYRYPEAFLPDDPVIMDETGTKSVISVDNGVITFLAIPCIYIHGQIISRLDVMRIDHSGWPYPGHPDESFQPMSIVDDHEINLADEGYHTVESVLGDDVSGLSVEGDIDRSIVRIKISAMCEDAISDDVEVPFAIYVTGETSDHVQLRSLVTKGMIRVVAGLIEPAQE